MTCITLVMETTRMSREERYRKYLSHFNFNHRKCMMKIFDFKNYDFEGI